MNNDGLDDPKEAIEVPSLNEYADALDGAVGVSIATDRCPGFYHGADQVKSRAGTLRREVFDQ
jgi:hypothetical protein